MAKQVIFAQERVGPWTCERTGGTFESDSTAIGLEEDGELVAGVVFDNYNSRSICMHIAAIPGARWMTREYLWVCFAYPFNQLKVNKILGLVDSTNHAARKFDEHLGFMLECNIKDAGRDGDLLIYSMTRQQCRFLGVKNGRQEFSTSST